MKTPTQRQFQKVISTLEKVYKKYHQNTPVDMMEGQLHYCGSPMCFAGWYAVAKGLRAFIDDYHDGTSLIAQDLGFQRRAQLVIWAESNPLIWGNTNGGRMFCSNYAFGDEYVTDLKQIIDHWKGVRERAKESKK